MKTLENIIDELTIINNLVKEKDNKLNIANNIVDLILNMFKDTEFIKIKNNTNIDIKYITDINKYINLYTQNKTPEITPKTTTTDEKEIKLFDEKKSSCIKKILNPILDIEPESNESLNGPINISIYQSPAEILKMKKKLDTFKAKKNQYNNQYKNIKDYGKALTVFKNTILLSFNYNDNKYYIYLTKLKIINSQNIIVGQIIEDKLYIDDFIIQLNKITQDEYSLKKSNFMEFKNIEKYVLKSNLLKH